METLQIPKDKAVTAYSEGDTSIRNLLTTLFGKKVFTRDVTERITSWQDVLQENGITQQQFDASCNGLESDEVASRQVKLIAKALNEDTVINLADTSQIKYFPWFKVIPDSGKPAGFGLSYGGCGSADASAGIGARHALKSEKLAIHAGKTFTEVYERLFA